MKAGDYSGFSLFFSPNGESGRIRGIRFQRIHQQHPSAATCNHQHKAGHEPGFRFFHVSIVGIGFRRSSQQPLFRSPEVRKHIDTYPSILGHQHEKLSRVYSLRFLNTCDLYPVSRENQRFIRRKVFFYNGGFSFKSRNINEKLIALRALAMLDN